jgi:acetyl esterase
VGDIPVRIYYPIQKRPLPALVYLHGGGWVVGSLDTHDKIMRLLALRSGTAVLGVDYRLSPEHKFPIALEEIVAVIKYLLENGDKQGIEKNRMALGGDSAGANLSAAVSVMLRPSYPRLLKLLMLFYGAYGLRDSGSRRLWGGPQDGMGEEELAFYHSCYLGGDENSNDPRYNILAADLNGLPPVFIAAAEYDPLIDDSTTLKALLDGAGVPNEFKLYEGVIHGFIHLSRMVDKASQAIDDAAQALRKVF